MSHFHVIYHKNRDWNRDLCGKSIKWTHVYTTVAIMCSCKKALPINCHSKQLKILGKLFSKKKTSYLFNTHSMSFSTSHILPKLTASAIHTIMMDIFWFTMLGKNGQRLFSFTVHTWMGKGFKMRLLLKTLSYMLQQKPNLTFTIHVRGMKKHHSMQKLKLWRNYKI